MQAFAEELDRSVTAWDRRGWPRPQVTLVTGSGLGLDLGEPLMPPVPLQELLPFAPRAVEGHALTAELYRPKPDICLLYLRGRLHCYQGFDPHQVVFPVRLAGLLGCASLLLTNAAGSCDPRLAPGSLVAIRDHLNLTGLNPLRGELPESWGPPFPSLDDAYDPELREAVQRCAERLGFELTEGVYAWLLGPSFETPAEIEMVRRLGASLVGMSTVPEVIAARHLGMRCLAISLVTNLAAGLTDTAPHHEEVMAEGRRAADRIASLVAELLTDPALRTETRERAGLSSP